MARRVSRRFWWSSFATLCLVVIAQRGETQTDSSGDPLPPGAKARIGTIRFRHSDAVRSLAYSADGKHITSAAQNAIAVWDSDSGRRVSLTPFPWQHASPAVSSDGTVVAHCLDKQGVLVREAKSGGVRFTLPSHEGAVRGLAFSNDGRLLATADDHSHLFLWDTTTGKLLRKWRALETNGDRCNQAFTADGNTLFHAAECGVIVSWDVASGKELIRIQPRKEKFGQYGLALSPDGQMLATICATGQRIDLWRLKTGEFLREIPANGATGLTFAPDSKHLLWSHHKEICLWDIAKDSVSRRIPALVGYPCRLAFSPDSKTLASGGDDHLIRLWDLSTGKEKLPAPAGQGCVASVRFLADGKTLLSSSGATCFLHDLEGKMLRRLVIPEVDAVNLVYQDGPRWLYDISPDGGTIVVWDLERRLLRLYDATSGKNLFDLAKVQGRVGGLRFSPDGRFVVIQSSGPLPGPESSIWELVQIWRRTSRNTLEKTGQLNSGLQRFWAPESRWIGVRTGVDLDFHHCETGRVIRSIPKLPRTISAASSSGRLLVLTSAWNSPPELWELATGRHLRNLECERMRMDFFRFAFSPDGKTVAAGLDSGAILLWDVHSGKQIGKLEGHHGNIISLEFSPDCRFLLSAGRDTTTLLWDCNKILPPTSERADFTDDILNTLWSNLQDADPVHGYQAVSLLASAPAQAIPLLKQKLKPSNAEDLRAIRAWIDDLDKGSFQVRSQAAAELARIGAPAEPLLQQTLSRPVSLECKRRVSEVLERMPSISPSPRWLQTLRALEALELIGTSEARKLVETLCSGLPEARQTQEACLALERMKKRGK